MYLADLELVARLKRLLLLSLKALRQSRARVGKQIRAKLALADKKWRHPREGRMRTMRILPRLGLKWRRRSDWLLSALDFRYRPPREETACPACKSTVIRPLDVLPLKGTTDGKRVGLMSGCEDCGAVFSDPMPTEDELAAIYAPGGEFNERREGEAIERARRAGVARSKLRLIFSEVEDDLNVLEPPPRARVLDFGCGDGAFLNSLQDQGWETYGVEPSYKAAFRRHREADPLPSEPTFDLVIVHHVLEHLRNPLEVLRDLAACMKLGGIMYVSVPRLDSVAEHLDLDYCIRSHGHIIAYTETCMRALMGRAGLEPVSGLNTEKYDDGLTHGRPVRMRLLARRTDAPIPVPREPLRAALDALSSYRWKRLPRTLHQLLLPVRLRAAMHNAMRVAHTMLKSD